MTSLRLVRKRDSVLIPLIAILLIEKKTKTSSENNAVLHPSKKPNVAKTKNGDALPTYSYINPPNGGPTMINNQ